LPQKEFGSLTSTLNWPWNLELAKKLVGEKYQFAKTIHLVQAKMQVKNKRQKRKVRNKSKT
jgi:hypothetical protein